MRQDQCSFLERWFRQVLNAGTSQSTYVIDRAYHIRAMRDNKVPPRTLIMKLLNYMGKLTVIAASQAKKNQYKD